MNFREAGFPFINNERRTISKPFINLNTDIKFMNSLQILRQYKNIV